jgi:hypothetical protein
MQGAKILAKDTNILIKAENKDILDQKVTRIMKE